MPLPGNANSYNGLFNETKENLEEVIVTAQKQGRFGEAVAVDVLTAAHLTASTIFSNNGNGNASLTGNTITGLNLGSGLGPIIEGSAYEALLPDGTFKFIILPEAVGLYTTSSSVLISNSFNVYTAKDNFYLNFPTPPFQTFDIAPATTLDPLIRAILKIGGVDAQGNVQTTGITSVNDSPWGMAWSDFLGGNSIITQATGGIALRGGYFNYNFPTTFTPGPIYFNASGALTSVAASQKIGEVIIDATLFRSGLIRLGPFN